MAVIDISRDIINRSPMTVTKDVPLEKRHHVPVNIKILKEPIPICCSCKKIRDAEGNWYPGEIYIRGRSKASITHGICPECTKKLYPMFYKDTS